MVGRPPKKSLDYAGWAVDIFDNDTKIDKLLEARGWEGFSIYFYLCQRAYGSEGYFYRWSYDDSASTSRKMGCGISAGTVRETVGYCLHIDLFDKGLFDRQGILTSRGIQRRYWEVVKTRDVRVVISDYWLLPDRECKGLIKLPLNTNYPEGNTNYPEGNTNYPEGNANYPAIKENEVKEEIVNTMCKADASALLDRLWKLYPCKKGKGRISDSQKMKLLKIGFDEMNRAIERYLAELKKDPWRKPQNGSTFFNSGYIDYLDANFVPDSQSSREPPNRRGSFNDFPQNDYDFSQLEAELMSN
ncbi:MAG: DUF4373 domain-containing protein [Firmicutes bacterium]|nr:DUF4373 domain-containing protein [Bacillota bacterium]